MFNYSLFFNLTDFNYHSKLYLNSIIKILSSLIFMYLVPGITYIIVNKVSRDQITLKKVIISSNSLFGKMIRLSFSFVIIILPLVFLKITLLDNLTPLLKAITSTLLINTIYLLFIYAFPLMILKDWKNIKQVFNSVGFFLKNINFNIDLIIIFIISNIFLIIHILCIYFKLSNCSIIGIFLSILLQFIYVLMICSAAYKCEFLIKHSCSTSSHYK